MPMASMLAPSQRDSDRNACHVRKSVVLMFRINLQITSRALSSARQPHPHERAVGSLVHLQSTQAGVVATVLAAGSTVGVRRSAEHQAESDARIGFASAVCPGVRCVPEQPART